MNNNLYFRYMTILWFLMMTPYSSLTLGNQNGIQDLDAITAAVRAFLDGLPTGGDPPSITVDALDSRLRLSACETPLEVSLAPGARSSGRTVVLVHCPSPRPWSLNVPAKVTTQVFVVVAARPISRDQVVTAADITVERRDSDNLIAGYLTDPNQILGKVLSRPATIGSILFPGQARAALVIHRGDRITLEVQGPGLMVRSMGEALADAGIGERISVRNESSRRIVEGTVKKAGVVVMDW